MTCRPGALRRTARAVAVGALVLAGLTALPTATNRSYTTGSSSGYATGATWN